MAMEELEVVPPRKEYMKLYINIMKGLAMWPRWKDGFWFSVWYYGTVFSVAASSIHTNTTLISKMLGSGDMENMATSVDYSTVFACGCFRYLYLFFRGNTVKGLIDSMQEQFIDESLNPEGEKLTMRESEKLGNRWAFIYIIASFPFVIQMIIVPFYVYATDPTVKQVPFMFDGWQPFNSTVEPNHSIVIILQGFAGFCNGYLFILSDAFWYMFIFLLIGQLQIIAHTYHNLVPSSGEEDCHLPVPKYADKVLHRAVIQHQKIRKMIKTLRNYLSPIVLVDFVHALMSISFLLLDITISLDLKDWGRITYLCEYLMVSVVHMFAYDYLGNELADEEEKLSDAIYDIPWYRNRKIFVVPLTMTTSAARAPIRLTGANFFTLTIEFFYFAMNTIFSYFMVLLELRGN